MSTSQVGYIYDVFISYRRHAEWTPWVRECLRPLLDAYLSQELATSPQIFLDEQLEPGDDWPNRLGTALARSRILIPIYSGDYFGSEWCVHELDLMHGRQMQCQDSKLIVPMLGHDGDLIPEAMGRILYCDIREFRNTDIQRKSPRFEKFSDAIKTLSPRVAAAICSAPDYAAAWEAECKGRFDMVYAARGNGIEVETQSFERKQLPRVSAPPRVTP